LDSEDPTTEIEWNAYSEQPQPVRHRRSLGQRIRSSLGEGLRSAGTYLLCSPIIIAYQVYLNLGARPSFWKKKKRDIKDFAGVSVALQSSSAESQIPHIKSLGVKRVLLRIPSWELDDLEKYAKFIEAIPECEVAICLMQTRKEVLDLELWHENIQRLLSRCWPMVKEYEFGQGCNRSKWGFFDLGDILRFVSKIDSLRSEYEGIKLISPSILDFEPVYLLRILMSFKSPRWDAVGCALYVDRRHAPNNRQLLFFDLKQKLLHFASCIRISNKANPSFWVTETNWPLKGQAPWAPTWEHDCVSEDEAAEFLRQYYRTAWDTSVVERVYWWQLTAKGFGLIDIQEDGTLRPRPAFHALKDIIENGFDS